MFAPSWRVAEEIEERGVKLFVWVDPYPVNYGSSMVFAVAETEESARAQVEGAPSYSFGQYENPPVKGLKLGDPTRIVELPCAEWHEWSE